MYSVDGLSACIALVACCFFLIFADVRLVEADHINIYYP